MPFCRSLYNTAIIVRLVLTWFPNPPQFIAGPLRYLHCCLHYTFVFDVAFICSKCWQASGVIDMLTASCVHLTSLTLIFWVCSTLCDPYLNLFRGIIPPLNGTIDLSPILAFIALDVSPYPETCLACAAVAELCMAYRKTFMHAHRVFCLTYHCNHHC